MKEFKDYKYQDSELVKQYAKARGESVEELTEKSVGNNGYTLGQEFHATGMTLVSNKNVAPYIAVTTKEGVTLSLRSLMGVSSLRGYQVAGTFESESYEKPKSPKDKEKVNKEEVTAEAVENFDFRDVFQPCTRQFLQFAAYCEGEHFWENKLITYLGQAVRPYEASKDNPKGSFELYHKGFKRAMTARLWAVYDDAEEVK